MKYLIGFSFILIMIGCDVKPQLPLNKEDNNISTSLKTQKQQAMDIYDLTAFPQTSDSYLKNINIKAININQQKYIKNYFRVWNKIPTDNLHSVMWPFHSYKAGNTYSENLHLTDDIFFISMKKNANFSMYKSINKNALTLKHLNIRVFPTNKPLFRDPAQAGEGFPFDYVQNSTIGANKPIFISHYSKDREWAYIFTSFAGGWVKVDEIVVIEKKHTSLWQKAEQIFLTKDNVAIYDENNIFLFKSRIGMMLALIGEDKDNYIVLSVSSYKNSQPNFHKSKISKKISHKGIMNFNKDNLKLIMDEVGKSKYGWGGIFNERDCSSTLRDIYTPFGLWLPRNSSQQSKVGKVIKLENLNDEQKLQLIKEKAIPFKTLLYKKGHILLYVGIYNDEVVAFHNVWGIRTKKESTEGRIIVGKAIYSTLSLGQNQEHYNEEEAILKNLKSINILIN